MVIVGLGNPGPAYSRTRHNLGAVVVEELAARHGAALNRARGQMRVAEATVAGRAVVLGVPTTFMNVSGPPIGKLVRKVARGPQDLVVCHDELDLPFGRLRFKEGGGTAGHNGLESICASLRSKDFLRLRIGIGKPPSAPEGRNFVLGKLGPEEVEALPGLIDLAVEGLETLVAEGLDAAQHRVHSVT
jgi:PTH1 family peptidyl-tRNA hydrolase